MEKNLKLYRYTFIVGLILVVFLYFLPSAINLPYQARPLVGLVVAPLMGLLGAIWAYQDEAYIRMVLNIILMGSYFIITYISYVIWFR